MVLLRCLLPGILLLLLGCGEAVEPPPSGEALQAQLTELAEAGDVDVQYTLAVAHGRGEFGEPDPSAFEYWLRRAAGNGKVQAQEQLGQLLLAVETPEADREALDWFQRAVTGGSPRAAYSLGVMYASARGVQADLAEAYLWLSLAAEQGHESAREAREQIGVALSEAQREAAQQRFQQYLQGSPGQ